jgi:protein-L-isoaspartate(D-aspartate) O-methyltransferase
MFETERREMVEGLLARGYVKKGRVAEALLRVERHHFLPRPLWSHAYEDRPLPIEEGQTISAPHMVAMMAELLELAPGMKVLEVGAGTGYHAAVIAELVRPGHVFSIEFIPTLAHVATENLRRAGYGDEVHVVLADGSLGLPAEAPFDRISVAAAAPRVPRPLKEQLKDGGILLVPVGEKGGQDLIRVRRRGHSYAEAPMGQVMFVPLVGEHGQGR